MYAKADIKISILNKKIEYLRKKLEILLSCNALTSPQVIECSQKSDKLLIEYENLKYSYKNITLKIA